MPCPNTPWFLAYHYLRRHPVHEARFTILCVHDHAQDEIVPRLEIGREFGVRPTRYPDDSAHCFDGRIAAPEMMLRPIHSRGAGPSFESDGQDIESVVADDASTDHTTDIVAAYAASDPRIRLIRRQSASGCPLCARNDGLRAARGEYVALLDADDVSLTTRLA